MEQSNKSKSGFNSKLGVILAAAGSAIGLGNIWKFPYEAGQNGGGAFLIVCLLCVILFGHNLFELSDTLVTTYMMPFGALAMSLFIGWFMPFQDNDLVPHSQKRYKQWLRPAFVFALRWLVPIAIVLIFLNGLGIFKL